MSDTYTTTATNATTQSHRPLVARLATVKDDDHSAWIIIAASLSVALILVFAGIRIFIRRVISPGVGLDDGLLAAATIFGCVEAALLLGACHVGLGRSAATLTHHALSTTREVSFLFYSTWRRPSVLTAGSDLVVLCCHALLCPGHWLFQSIGCRFPAPDCAFQPSQTHGQNHLRPHRGLDNYFVVRARAPMQSHETMAREHGGLQRHYHP